MNFCDLSEKNILITGASSGIGKQAAINISKQGGNVIITGRNENRLKETFDQLEGENHKSFVFDLSEEKQINDLVKEIPKLNGIVHCAGIVLPMPVKFIRKDDIKKMNRIHYELPVLLNARILLTKKLLNNSSIIFMSTISTKLPFFGGTLYNSAKSAIEVYSKTLALELVKKGIRSNCLSPGLVDTPLISEPAKKGQVEVVEDSLKKYLQKFPMGVGEPQDVANTIVFLLSDEAKWISGANIELGGVIQ